MKKFLLHIALFSFILLVIAISFDVFLTHKAKQVLYSPFATWNDIYQHNIHSDVIMMGSSRSYVHFNPAVIDTILNVNSYNLGMNGRSADSQIKKYRIYRQQGNPAPQLIIYEVSHATMHKSNGYEREQFIPYLHDSYLWELFHEQEKFSLADRWIPSWRYLGRKKLVHQLIWYSPSKPNSYNLYKGFLGHDKKWDGEALKKRSSIDYGNDRAVIRQFQDFLTECRQEGTQVVLVISPFYIEGTKKMTDYEGMHNMYKEIAQKNSIALLDYTFDELSYDTTYFYNTMHLNKKGADLFSRKVAHDIDSLGVLSRPTCVK